MINNVKHVCFMWCNETEVDVLVWNETWLGWTLAWDYNAWDGMWNVDDKRVSRKTLGDGVVSVYLNIGDV